MENTAHPRTGASRAPMTPETMNAAETASAPYATRRKPPELRRTLVQLLIAFALHNGGRFNRSMQQCPLV